MATRSILVVEDEAIVAANLCRRLEAMGYAVIAAVDSGEAALEHITARRPDLVLVDIMLAGDLDGIALAQQIHDRFALPVVYLTAYADDETVQRAGPTHPYGYILKPFDENSLRVTLDIALHRHRADRAVRERERWLDTILRSIGDAVVTTDAQAAVSFVNPAAAAMTGWTEAAAAGKPVEQVVALRDAHSGQAAPHPVIQALQTGEVVNLAHDTLLVTQQGTQVFIEDSAAPIRADHEALLGAVMVFRDATARRKIERLLQEARRFESLSILAGGIAHDFNNLLMGIMGNAELAMHDLAADHGARINIEQALTSTRRAAELTRQLSLYAGRERLHHEVIHINRLIEDLVDSIRSSLAANVTLDLALAADLPPVQGDAALLRQSFWNILMNAVEALDQRNGALAISTTTETLARSDLDGMVFGATCEPGDYIGVTVHDTGHGMDTYTSERMFEPFYSTRFVGRGLGLSTVQGVVHGHRGALTVISQVDQGTTFQVWLPVLRPVGAIAGPTLAADPSTVLIVDDEAPVRDVAERIVERLGYTVLTTGDGPAAIALVQSGRFDLLGVLLDLTMPQMSGDHVARAIADIAPDVPVVLMSGYNVEAISRQYAELSVAGFLQKPFSIETIRATLHDFRKRRSNG